MLDTLWYKMMRGNRSCVHEFKFDRLRVCCIESWISWSPHWSSEQRNWEPWINNWDDEAQNRSFKSPPKCCWLSCVYFIWLSVSPTIASDAATRSLLGPWLKWEGVSGVLHIQRLLQPLIELMTCSNTLLSATFCAINSSSGNMADDLIHALSVFPPLSSPRHCPRLISCRVIDVK